MRDSAALLAALLDGVYRDDKNLLFWSLDARREARLTPCPDDGWPGAPAVSVPEVAPGSD